MEKYKIRNILQAQILLQSLHEAATYDKLGFK